MTRKPLPESGSAGVSGVPELVQRAASALLCVLAFALIGILPLGVTADAIVDVDVDQAIAHGDTRGAAVAYLSKRIAENPAIKKLVNTPLELDDEDIRTAVRAAVTRDALATPLRQASRGLGDRITDGNRERVAIDLTELRSRLLEGLHAALALKLQSLPRCDVGEHVEAAWDALEGYITDASATEILADLPRCRPIVPLGKEVEARLTEHFRGLHRHHEIVLFERGEATATTGFFAWCHRWLYGWIIVPWMVLCGVLLTGFATLQRWRRRRVVPYVGIGLAAISVVWTAMALVAYGLSQTPEPAAYMFVRCGLVPVVAPLLRVTTDLIAVRLGLLAVAMAVATTAVAWIARRRAAHR